MPGILVKKFALATCMATYALPLAFLIYDPKVCPLRASLSGLKIWQSEKRVQVGRRLRQVLRVECHRMSEL